MSELKNWQKQLVHMQKNHTWQFYGIFPKSNALHSELIGKEN